MAVVAPPGSDPAAGSGTLAPPTFAGCGEDGVDASPPRGNGRGVPVPNVHGGGGGDAPPPSLRGLLLDPTVVAAAPGVLTGDDAAEPVADTTIWNICRI